MPGSFSVFVPVLFFLLSVCFVQEVLSQEDSWSIGIKGGVNVSSYQGKTVEASNGIFGYHAGIYSKVFTQENNFWQPEICFSTKGSRHYDEYINVVQKLYYIDIPVLFHFANDKGIGVFLGPQLSGLIHKTNQVDEGTGYPNIIVIYEKKAIKPYDLSVAGGFMFVLEDLFNIEARASFSIPNFIDQEKLDGQTIKGRILNIQLSVGIDVVKR